MWLTGSQKFALYAQLFKGMLSLLALKYCNTNFNSSVFFKSLEKLLYKRIQQFLNKHEILYKEQYGFRKKHSTQFAVIELMDRITRAIDN